MRALAALVLAALVAVAAGASAAAPTGPVVTPGDISFARRQINKAIGREETALNNIRRGAREAALDPLERSMDDLGELLVRIASNNAFDAVATSVRTARRRDSSALDRIDVLDSERAERYVLEALGYKRAAHDELDMIPVGEQTPTRPDFTAMGSAENTGSGRTTFSFDLPGGIGRIITILISLDRPPFNRTGAAREQGPIKGSSGYTIGKNGPTGKGSCTTRAGVVTCKLKQAIPSGGFFLIELSPELPVGTKLLAKLKTADGKYGVARATVRQL